MHKRLIATCLAAGLVACSGSDNTPQTKLSITPSGTQSITGPTLITASEADVTWAATGGGTLSGTTGKEVTYQPPGGSATATVTATANGQTASVTFNVTPPQAAIPGGQIANMTAPATVDFDAEGIPHIFCATVIDCFRVQGFLHAQDRLFQMDFFRRTAEGKLSTLLGAAGVSSDKQLDTVFTTRDGSNVGQKILAGLDPDTRAKLDGYVEGVNAYLAFLQANPALMPVEYSQISAAITPATLLPWTELDSAYIGRLQQFQLSESIEEETAYGLIAQVFQSLSPGRVSTYVRAQQPIQDYTLSGTDPAAARAVPAPAPAATFDMSPWLKGLGDVNASFREMREMFGTQRLGAGSNNWVVDGAHSATGKAMVANDPHLQLFYPPLFHLSAMTAADGSVDLAGGTFPGVPGALVGRGAHVGWGVTVVGYDVTDLYLETAATCASPFGCVLFNGAAVPLQLVQYDNAAVAGGKINVLVVPHHGPVINQNPMISMRWTGHEVSNDFLGFFGLATATAVGTTTDLATAKTAFGALRNYAVGAQNFVLADDQGNIGYDPHALVPKRPWAGTVVTLPGVGATPLFPWLPLPGIGVAEWGPTGTDCSVANPPSTCWVDDANLPQSVNPAKGYLATANSDPVGTTDDNNPVTNAPISGNTALDAVANNYLSFDWDDPTTVRYARIASLLSAKTAGGGKVSMADMQAIQSDHTIQLADLFLKSPQFPQPAAATGANAAPYATAFAMLTAWQGNNYDCPTGLTGTSPSSPAVTDAPTLANSAACLLFHQFLRTILANVFNDELAFIQAAAGQNPGADSGRQIRALLFMLTLAPGATGTEFCNDISTAGATTATHSCADQVVTAMVSALTTVSAQLGPPPAAGATTTTWLWGKFHTLTTLSPAAPLIAGGFSGGPFARPGGALSVDVGNPDGSQSSPLGFTYSHGSNVRFIGEIQDPTASTNLMQLPGLERDVQFQPGPTDLLTPYAANTYFNYLMNHTVDANTVSTQTFVKNPSQGTTP
jgi:penicillin amidase